MESAYAVEMEALVKQHQEQEALLGAKLTEALQAQVGTCLLSFFLT